MTERRRREIGLEGPTAPVVSERRPGPERVVLDNGLTVLFEEHRAANVAAVQLWVGVGARDEADDEAGLSHFVEHLLFKGTATRGPGEIDRTISGLGGEMNAATAHDFTYYHVVLPARHVGTALEVVADAAMHASLPPDELERERLVVLEEIRRAEDNPSGSLWRTLARCHFSGHPYGRPVLGAPEVIRGAPRERIVAYYGRSYVPANATLVVVGNLDREQALGQARRAFGAWGSRPASRVEVGPPREPETAQRVEKDRPLQQTYVGMVWAGPAVPEPDVYAVDVLASVLGRGRTSRLHRTLREERRLVSSISANSYLQGSAGAIVVTARTTADREREVEAAVMEEVERVSDGLAGEGELTRALTGIEADHAFGRETAEGVAYAYGSAETVWTLDFELTYLDEIRKVTPGRLRDAARRYLLPGRVTVAVLGPRDGGS